MKIQVKSLAPSFGSASVSYEECAPAILRCVYCHDDVRCGGLHVANCESCQVCFHTECREQFSGDAQCPTLGCPVRLDDTWHRSEDRIWSLEAGASSSVYILDSFLALLMFTLSAVGAVVFTSGLTGATLIFGGWLSSFDVLGFQLIGLFFVLLSFVQMPFASYYSFQYLYQRTYPRRV
ncbi:MAG: hypothetical protein P1V97_05650 [Planctomycetota bacterium]|nr:hypothetical protein [Planctomycetota bacterium]